jgi:hypothetical protein
MSTRHKTVAATGCILPGVPRLYKTRKGKAVAQVLAILFLDTRCQPVAGERGPRKPENRETSEMNDDDRLRLADKLWRENIRAGIHLPVVTTAEAFDPEDIDLMLHELQKLHAMVDDIASYWPFTISTEKIALDTPLGIVLVAISSWCAEQKAKLLAELEALNPSGLAQKEDRLHILIGESRDPDRILQLATEYQKIRAQRLADRVSG